MSSALPLPLDCAGLQAKRSRRKDARPGELLDAALALFVEKGYAATRAEEVAKRAGVSKGTLFLYFSSKEELFKAVVRETISSNYPAWIAELETFAGSTPDLLRRCFNVWWERVGATQASGISKLMMSEAGNFPELAAFYEQEVVQPGNALIQRILQRGVQRGEFRAIDATYGVYTVLAPMLFLVMLKHSQAVLAKGHARGEQIPSPVPLAPQDYINTQLETLLYGLCPRSGPLPGTPPLPQGEITP